MAIQGISYVFSQALKVGYPGYILPYFCSSEVVQSLQAKMPYLNPRQRQIYLVSRLQQLRYFLDSLVKHTVFGFSQELRIFFIQEWEEHKKERRNCQLAIEELEGFKENKKEGIIARLAGFARKRNSTAVSTADFIVWSSQWLDLKNRFERYSTQLFNLTEKMFMFKHFKQSQVNWKGPQTQIDAFEQLKAKITSANPFSDFLIAEIECKILLPLANQCKKQEQMRRQMEQREGLGRMIRDLRRQGGSEGRAGALQVRGQRFESHFSQSFVLLQQQWLKMLGEINVRFNAVMQSYMNRMYQIWK